mmetsp:Transcript_4318/g.7572  ORF Transcript_4318/g.7572 Transcript_4318/m.7572 type:complete len:583 (-) Transcript_4318:660-2408(-)
MAQFLLRIATLLALVLAASAVTNETATNGTTSYTTATVTATASATASLTPTQSPPPKPTATATPTQFPPLLSTGVALRSTPELIKAGEPFTFIVRANGGTFSPTDRIGLVPRLGPVLVDSARDLVGVSADCNNATGLQEIQTAGTLSANWVFFTSKSLTYTIGDYTVCYTQASRSPQRVAVVQRLAVSGVGTLRLSPATAPIGTSTKIIISGGGFSAADKYQFANGSQVCDPGRPTTAVPSTSLSVPSQAQVTWVVTDTFVQLCYFHYGLNKWQLVLNEKGGVGLFDTSDASVTIFETWQWVLVIGIGGLVLLLFLTALLLFKFQSRKPTHNTRTIQIEGEPVHAWVEVGPNGGSEDIIPGNPEKETADQSAKPIHTTIIMAQPDQLESPHCFEASKRLFASKENYRSDSSSDSDDYYRRRDRSRHHRDRRRRHHHHRRHRDDGRSHHRHHKKDPEDIAVKELRQWSQQRGGPPLQTTESVSIKEVMANQALLTLCNENIELDKMIEETKAAAMKLIADLHETQTPERPPYHYPTFLGIGLTSDPESSRQVQAHAQLGGTESPDLSIRTFTEASSTAEELNP